MECHPAVGSKCGVGILHVCQVKKTITKNVPTIILTVHLRTWLISRKLSLCGLFWTTLYICLYLGSQSALEFCPIHCPNGRLGKDLGFGRFAFALKLPELLNTNLAAVRAKLGQRSCFPNW